MRKTFIPLLLMSATPFLVIFVWYVNVFFSGNLFLVSPKEFFILWSSLLLGSPLAWKMIGVFAFVELVLMKLPGKEIRGPITPMGQTPIYKNNGFLAFVLTLVLFYLAAYPLQLFSPTLIYDHFGELLGALGTFSLLFCLFLYLKGRFFPSSPDCVRSRNPIFDYFWGVELYPRIAGFDVKLFTNCRFGMMSWPLIIWSFLAKQSELYGLSDAMLVSVVLQFLYVAKFFFWEPGYLSSLDIMHDKAGYYLCWGCLVWVPGIYTSVSLYLVNHPVQLGEPLAWILFLLGVIGIVLNYWADRQRQQVRKKKGQCLVWGKRPLLIAATYTTEDGREHQSLLLASGWWGMARHFHYSFELLAALCWSLPALFTHLVPYFYFLFLAFLLLDRAFRHERRCFKKYGATWEEYCRHVPYKLIPFIY